MNEHDLTFDAMGSHVRFLLGEGGEDSPPASAAAQDARRFVEDFDRRLSRFRAESELCALNEDPREVVPASDLLRDAVRSGLRAAERTGGLIDPTLVGEIESAGYRSSRAGMKGAPLAEALRAAPPRRAAAPSPEARWRLFEIDDEAGTVARPPGLRFDTGGTGKGLAADMVAARFRGYPRFIADCGGDIRIGGPDALARPYEIYVEHPLTGGHAHVLRLGFGAVATSGINVRIWRREDGSFFHHLLDPCTGEPAWTGLVGVTALGDTALEAETICKAALLSGPDGGRELLADRGGLLVHESGRVEPVGPLAIAPPRIRWPEPAEPARSAA
ncbi:MAG: FAD:protein FMN transferase [Solirubrobacterales bacterium]